MRDMAKLNIAYQTRVLARFMTEAQLDDFHREYTSALIKESGRGRRKKRARDYRASLLGW